MSDTKRRARRAATRRREQRRMRMGAALLTIVCAVALGAMAFVNHMPMGDRYTYTDKDDLWYVEGGNVAIAAPALLFSLSPTAAPSATPEVSATPEASATPDSATPEPSAEPSATPEPRPVATETAVAPA